ncbi:MAG: hypothetical protein K5792_08435 [Butyrivibrio sp.]|nr:hypothetical protein [Butyrivibrio sp.]
MNKYNEVMDNIKVTEDMRSRILQNIEAEIGKDSSGETVTEPVKKAKVVDYRRIIRIASTAAAVIVGAVILSNVMLRNTTDSSSYSAQVSEAEMFAVDKTEASFEAAGSEGAYAPVDECKTVNIDGVDVKFYGSDGLYYAAEWVIDGENYSAVSDNVDGVSLEEMKALVAKNMEKVKNN